MKNSFDLVMCLSLSVLLFASFSAYCSLPFSFSVLLHVFLSVAPFLFPVVSFYLQFVSLFLTIFLRIMPSSFFLVNSQFGGLMATVFLCVSLYSFHLLQLTPLLVPLVCFLFALISFSCSHLASTVFTYTFNSYHILNLYF